MQSCRASGTPEKIRSEIAYTELEWGKTDVIVGIYVKNKGCIPIFSTIGQHRFFGRFLHANLRKTGLNR